MAESLKNLWLSNRVHREAKLMSQILMRWRPWYVQSDTLSSFQASYISTAGRKLRSFLMFFAYPISPASPCPVFPPPTYIRKGSCYAHTVYFRSYPEPNLNKQFDVGIITSAGVRAIEAPSSPETDLNRIDDPPPAGRYLCFRYHIISSLSAFPKLGIHRLYHSWYFDSRGVPEDLAERGCPSPSLNEETLNRLDSSWRNVLTLSSTGVLTSVMGLFQLLSSCNDVIFTSLVLGAMVLVWATILCSSMYTGYKKSFLTSRAIAEQFASASSPNSSFWSLAALPAILLSWGVLLCCIATLYVSFTGFGNTEPATCGITSWKLPTAVSGILVLGISAISGTLIYTAKKKILHDGL